MAGLSGRSSLMREVWTLWDKYEKMYVLIVSKRGLYDINPIQYQCHTVSVVE